MNEETALTIEETVDAIRSQLDALGQQIDGGDPETEARLLRARDEINDEVAEFYRKVAGACGRYDFTKNLCAVPGGQIKRSWRGGKTTWDWPLARAAMRKLMVERTSEEYASLIEVCEETFADLVGLTPSVSGRVTHFQNAGIWSDAFTRTEGGGYYTYKYEEVADGEPAPEPD